MPPASPPSDEPTAVTDVSPLTDEDVEILHEIIAVAEQTPNVDNLPFRAIFAAYDQVLAKHGLDSDHDQIYLRFLFRLGNKKQPGQSLFEVFEELLLEQGIQVLFGEEDSGSQEADTGLAEAGTPGATRVRSRRASFSSYIDPEEITRTSQFRADSRASESRVRVRRPSTRATTRPTERVEPRITRSRTARGTTGHGRLTASEFASNNNTPQKRQASLSGQDNNHVHQHMPSRAKYKPTRSDEGARDIRVDDPVNIDGDGTQDTTLSSLRSLGSPLHLYKDVLFRPSDTQLLRDADTFEHFRIRNVARESIRKWRISAVNTYHGHRAMYKQAIAHDQGILVRQAFDQWRSLYLAKKQAAETERFFNHLERRARKARDLYLLTKAFTHWAQCASEEVEQTSVARRHILRTRYFSAWMEISAVNELKVRRQGLRKFFVRWKQARGLRLVQNSSALTVYYDNIVERVYWTWFWRFCERRAPEWRNARLKRRYFIQWLATHRTDEEMREFAMKSRQINLQRRYFGRWLRKTRDIQLQRQQAQQFYHKSLIVHCVSMWQKQVRFLPSIREIQAMDNWRIASNAFSALILRFRCEKQAEQVNRQRVLRTAWTQWNDRLRWQTLKRQIDDRLLVQALYKWVLAERLSLLQRLSEERLKRRILVTFLDQKKHLELQQDQIFQVIVERRNRSLLGSIVGRWHEKLQVCNQDNRLAFEFHAPKIAQETVQAWKDKHEHNQKMEKWARDAFYYFRCTKIFKRWQAAVAESKSQKRRAAYANIRRRVKMNLARRTLSQWHLQMLRISTLHDQANEYLQQRGFLFATSLFDRWRARLDSSLTASTKVIELRAESIAHGHLNLWYSRFQTIQEANTKAIDFSTSHIQKVAYEAIRSLQLKVFEHRSHAQTAADLRAWNTRRHYRSFLRIWREKTLRKRGVDISIAVPNTDFARSYRSRRAAGARPSTTTTTLAGGATTPPLDDDDNFELGDWIPALEAQSSMTPLPGYLSTPSKRAARARAMVRGTSVPATPVAFRTPLRRRVAATDGRVGRSGLADFGRSLRASRFEGGRFEDIMEGESKSQDM